MQGKEFSNKVAPVLVTLHLEAELAVEQGCLGVTLLLCVIHRKNAKNWCISPGIPVGQST